MKQMIRSVAEASGAEYQLWAEVTPAQGPGELYAVKFTSIWTGAKQPDAPQSRGDFFLDKTDLARLLELIKNVTA